MFEFTIAMNQTFRFCLQTDSDFKKDFLRENYFHPVMCREKTSKVSYLFVTNKLINLIYTLENRHKISKH